MVRAAGGVMKADIVILATADWSNPFWTNKQHVAVELARRGHRVLYVDSLGLRRPSVSSHDLKRVCTRLVRGLRPPRQVRERLWVWSPLVIPLQRYSAVRRLNRLLLSWGLRLSTRWLGLAHEVLWTYNPMTTRLFPTASFATVVYHCVDEIGAQRGMPTEEIEAAERELLARADHCFVTAHHLLERRRGRCRDIRYFPNVADFEHFVTALSPSTRVPEDLARIPGPRIGFVGAITDHKLDLTLLQALATAHPEYSIVLLGKVGEGDPWADVESLRTCSNVHFLGPRPYASLPAYLKGFDVALLPSVINGYTLGMFPMKFFEYLGAGCPVVATALPSLAEFGHVAALAATPAQFVAAVERALQGEAPALERRLAVAREHTYERRTALMMELLEAR
jgi:glycosyltransferase involved in cell wall biosynthesis